MRQYLDLLDRVVTRGERVATGTYLPGAGRKPHALCLVGQQYRHDLGDGFPAVTTKKLFWKGVVAELLWFLRGETTLDFLHSHDVHIWDQWAGKSGHAADGIGPGYGEQWRRWKHPRGEWDQVASVVAGLKAVVADPADRARRRLVVSAWNAPLVPEMGLAPCHTLWQALPTNGVLHMVCHWRSIDMLFGFPFNVASYALLTHMLCEVTGLTPGTLVANIADCHLYDNQVAAAREQLGRDPKPLPELAISHRVREWAPDLSADQVRNLDPFDFALVGYEHHPKLTVETEIAE